jgi:hypothetical protein
MKRQAAALFLSLSFAAPQAGAGEVAHWNRVATDAAVAAQLDPLNESRIFAIVHASIHDALNAIDRRYEAYQAQPKAAAGASPQVAVAAAAHAALVELIPARKALFDAALADAIARANGQQGLDTGRQAAAIILAKRRDDGASRNVAHLPGKKPGEYRPTPPDFTPGAFANWGAIRPFVLASAAQFRPARPLDPKGTRAREEMEEVRTIGGETSSRRTAEQSEIARYWYESSPQGWNRIARAVAVDRALDEWESARLLALVNFAMADGFIGGFEAKYHYNYWRPATAIREVIESGWMNYLSTPPVPDYPSTHTVLGAAAAAVLERHFGTDFVSFSMTSGEPYPGITRKFWSFSEAARENGASRILAGIHFAAAVRAGYEQGERIGHWTYERALRPVRSD